jgi:hypothetical protein
MNEKQQQEVRKDIEVFQRAAQTMILKNQDDYLLAGKLLSNVKTSHKILKDRLKEITGPIQEALKSTRQLFQGPDEALEKVKTDVESAMKKYLIDEEAKAAKEKAQIMARVEKGTMREDTAVKKMVNIAEVPTKGEGFTTRRDKKVRIVDETLVPENYWIIDKTKVTSDLLSGIPVPGAEIYEEVVFVNKK